MLRSHFIKLGIFAIGALICTSGQMPKNEVNEFPSTQIDEMEQTEKLNERAKPKVRTSAAKRSMEPTADSSIHRKSAARKIIEERY